MKILVSHLILQVKSSMRPSLFMSRSWSRSTPRKVNLRKVLFFLNSAAAASSLMFTTIYLEKLHICSIHNLNKLFKKSRKLEKITQNYNLYLYLLNGLNFVSALMDMETRAAAWQR